MKVRLVIVKNGKVIKEQITTTDKFIVNYTDMTEQEQKELEQEIEEKGYTYFDFDTYLIYLYKK